MSGTEDSDPDWGESAIKQVPDSSHKSNIQVQKFCEKWLKIFDPWLARCSDNPNKPFCRACQTKLDCNRCHLQRHERTSKHARNLKILVEKGEEAALENFNMRQEKSKYYQQRKKLNILQTSADFVKEENDEDYITEEGYDENETFDFVQADESHDQYIEQPSFKQTSKSHGHNTSFSANTTTLPQRKTPSTSKKDRIRLLMQIQKDKNDIMSTFKDLMAANNNTTILPPKEKNNVDLFFESVSSSVKALSPKLIAEAKMRVSQLICELELRALTEAEDQSNSVETIMTPSTIVVSPNAERSYVLHGTVEGHPSEDQTTAYESLH